MIFSDCMYELYPLFKILNLDQASLKRYFIYFMCHLIIQYFQRSKTPY